MSTGEAIDAAWLECPVCARDGVDQDTRNQLRVGVNTTLGLIAQCPRCFNVAPIPDELLERGRLTHRAWSSSRGQA